MKEENGITLTKLCIVLSFYLLLILISVFALKNSYKTADLEKFVSKMELVQEKVNLIRNNYKLWEDYDANNPGNYNAYLKELGFSNANNFSNIYITEFNGIIKELNESNVDYWDSNTDSIISNYFYLGPDDISKYLGLKNIDLHIIINFYTGNVIEKDGIIDITNSNKRIYRQYDTKIGNKLVLSEISSNTVFPKIEIIENYGLKQKVKIFLTSEVKNIPDILEIYYYNGENDDIKKNATKFQDYIYVKEEKAVYFTIDLSGDYTFIIKDTNYIEYPKVNLKVNLCNPPVLAEGMKGIYWNQAGEEIEIQGENDPNWYNYSSDFMKMANVKSEDGNYWVWLPKYVYKEADGEIIIDFVKGSSSISTKNKQNIGYKLQEAFENDGNLKGIWIAKFQASRGGPKTVDVKPGKPLRIFKTQTAKENCEKYIDNSLKKYSRLISIHEINAIILYSKSEEIEIANDLVHYAGGAVDKYGYISNVQYSSTNNVFGIYDLITSENEVTIESNNNDEGRYRPVLLIK